MSRLSLFALVLTVCLYASMRSNAQETCSDALKDIRNNLITSNNSVSKEVYKRYFFHLTNKEAYEEYSKAHDSSNDSSGMFEVTIPIDDVPVTPKANGSHGEKLTESEFNKRFEKWKETVKDQIESEKFYSESNYYNESKINNASVAAWERCMSTGLFAYASRGNADTVMLKVYWKTDSTQSVKLDFITPTGVNIDANADDLFIHGSRVFKVTGKVSDGFSIAVNAKLLDSSGTKVGDIGVPDIIVGPAVLTNLPERPQAPVDSSLDLQNLQTKFVYKDFLWNGDWPRHQTVLEVSDYLPQHKGKRIVYTIELSSYYNLHSYFYRYKVFVNDREEGIIQNNNYSSQPHGIGEDPKTFDGELVIPPDGRINIRVECVSFDSTIKQVDFGIYNASIKTKFK